jgi:hypothetical protein
MVANLLWPPISAPYVRVNPLTWTGNLAMRCDVLGCE